MLAIVVGSWSKDVIEPWEGILTFLFFPLLVVVAFLADKGYFTAGGTRAKEEFKRSLEGALTTDFAQMDRAIRQKYGENISDEEVARHMEAEYGGRVSRAAYRIGAIRSLVGGKRIQLRKADTSSQVAVKPAPFSSAVVVEDLGKTFVEFVSEAYSVSEGAGSIQILVRRRGNNRGTVKVSFKTRDGEAMAGQDYEHKEGTLVFPPPDSMDGGDSTAQQSVLVKIINDKQTELDECFYVDLFDACRVKQDDDGCECAGGGSAAPSVELGESRKTCKIKIIDDDLPGELCFAEQSMQVMEESQDSTIQVKVTRVNGTNGEISCKFRTEEDSAIDTVDFEHVAGELVFGDGQETATIGVCVKARGRYDESDLFRLILEEAKGTKFNAKTDGGEESDICSITILSSQASKDQVDRVMKLMKSKMAKAEVGHRNWKSQFIDALFVGGGGDDLEEGEEMVPPGVMDWVMHVITIFWKLLFAFIPPTDYCGGWLCFSCALSMIGGVTLVIGELATILGCVWGIPDAITAITFVALGTSLPDTFASKTAAVQDEFADASIGNVTGSNSVNVFLGIGLPWMMGAIFWNMQSKDKDAARYAEWIKRYPVADFPSLADYPDGNAFVVPGGSLETSVIVFCGLAVLCLLVLMVRRFTPSIGGELGGPTLPKIATAIFLVMLWFVYLIVSVITVVANLDDCDK
jgi:solute carrier family 8 (sodium/calcium exchanger)